MKKIFIILTLMAVTLAASAFNKDAVKGQWTATDSIGTVVLTITSDSIEFNEVGNEDFIYEYAICRDDIVYTDGFISDVLHFIMIDTDTIAYSFNDDPTIYVLNRKD